MAEVDLQTIEKTLQERALQLEQQRLDAHATAMKEIADARTAEEQRRKSAQEIIDAKQELFNKRKAAEKQAEAEAQQQERELQTLMEQEHNRKQAEIDAVIARKEAITKRLADMEHQEELAKKELRDLILNNTVRPDTERIMENPLARFLQTEPK